MASWEARWLELQEATDFLDRVVDVPVPMLQLSLNPEVLRLDTTQGSFRRGRGLLWQRRAEGGAACTGHPMLEYHEANDRSNWVVNAFDPIVRLTLNPEVLKLDATQEFLQRARTPSASAG